MDGKKVYKSMYEWLNMWAEQYGGHEALCDNKGSYSYESLNTSVKNLSIGFADMGLRKSDKVILQLDNCNEFVIVCFALMSMGVIPILAVPGLRVNDLDIIAKKANPVMYIRPDEYMGFIYAETGRKMQIMNPSIKYVLGTSDINKMMEQSNNSAVEIEQPKAEDIGLILLSGGTTNIPKLIPVTHYAFAYHASEAGKTCRFNRETIYMAVMPVEHKLTLFSPGIMGTLFCGGKVVMCSDSSCETAFSLIEEEQVNVVSLVPSVAKMWVEDLEWDDSYDFSSLKYCMLGGAKLEETDARKIMDSLNCDIIQGYGMSEGFLSLSTWKDSAYERINYQGKPMSDEDQVIIVDDDGKEQPYGIEGEILVKGPYLFSGYYEMDSSECFNADGFYHTGDLGYITADGYIKITGRKSDQINRMGEKIMPSEIENYLAEHEKIMEVVVMGIPDTMLGERSCAFLRMAKGNVKPEELREHLSKKGVAQYKIPDQMILLDEFPHTATGKINKRMLLTMANK